MLWEVHVEHRNTEPMQAITWDSILWTANIIFDHFFIFRVNLYYISSQFKALSRLLLTRHNKQHRELLQQILLLWVQQRVLVQGGVGQRLPPRVGVSGLLNGVMQTPLPPSPQVPIWRHKTIHQLRLKQYRLFTPRSSSFYSATRVGS